MLNKLKMKLNNIITKILKDNLDVDDLILIILFSCAGLVTLLRRNQSGDGWTTRGLSEEGYIGLFFSFLLGVIILGIKFFFNFYFWKKSIYFNDNIEKHIHLIIISWIIYLIVLGLNQLELFNNILIPLFIGAGFLYFIIYFIFIKKQMNKNLKKV